MQPKLFDFVSIFYEIVVQGQAQLTLDSMVQCSNLGHTFSFSQGKLLVSPRFDHGTVESKVSYACPQTTKTDFSRQKNFVSQFTWWETQRPPPMGNQLENNPWGIGLRYHLVVGKVCLLLPFYSIKLSRCILVSILTI